MNNPLRSIANSVTAWARARWPKQYSYDTLPPPEMRAALDLPWVRSMMIQFSREEYGRNPYYASVVNKQAEQVIGPCPTMIATAQDDDVHSNDMVEDGHLEWTQLNGIGFCLRQLRKDACLTGLGIMVPVSKPKSEHPVKVGFKNYGFDALQNPTIIPPSSESRLIDGIEYDKDWEPVRFYFKSDNPYDPEPVPIDADKLIYWSRGYENGVMNPTPECVTAFTIYPYIRRFLQAAIEGEEFRTSFPMALELDDKVYKPQSNANMLLQSLEKFTYQPKSVPSLPVGTKLVGVPSGQTSANAEKLLRNMASAAALSIDMPANLALGDSSDANMATAQVDMQPWKNRVHVDRFDLMPVLRRTFKYWWDGARFVRGLTPESAREGNPYHEFYPHTYVYDPLFQHPDPLKNSNARAVDLASGVGTLNLMYSQLGLNPRRQLQREADLLGITYEELIHMILATRSNLVLNILGETEPSNSEN